MRDLLSTAALTLMLIASTAGAAPSSTALATVSATVSATAPFAEDGWYTWRVSTVDDAPRWCCLDWSGGRAVPKTCTLGGGYFSFGNDPSAHLSAVTSCILWWRRRTTSLASPRR